MTVDNGPAGGSTRPGAAAPSSTGASCWPGSRLRASVTWTGTPLHTEVEVSFAALGPALTRVTVEHRGWEAMTGEQLAQDCALPGGYSSRRRSAARTRILALGRLTLPVLPSPARPGPACVTGAPDERTAYRDVPDGAAAAHGRGT